MSLHAPSISSYPTFQTVKCVSCLVVLSLMSKKFLVVDPRVAYSLSYCSTCKLILLELPALFNNTSHLASKDLSLACSNLGHCPSVTSKTRY